MQPRLLVTNTPLDMMVKSSNLPRLLTYFEYYQRQERV